MKRDEELETLRELVLQKNREAVRNGRLFIASAFLCFLAVIFMAFYVSYKYSMYPRKLDETKASIIKTLREAQTVQGTPGDDGRDGLPGPVGKTGANGYNGQNGSNGVSIPGKDGANITPDQIAFALSDYLRLNPVATVTGARGAPGEQQLLQVNSDTCELMSKYISDDSWSIIAQLPKPCEPQ